MVPGTLHATLASPDLAGAPGATSDDNQPCPGLDWIFDIPAGVVGAIELSPDDDTIVLTGELNWSGYVGTGPDDYVQAGTCIGWTDAFVAKLDATTGELVWAKVLTSCGSQDEGMDLAVGPGGAIAISGRFGGPLSMDGQVVLDVAWPGGGFAAEFTADGVLVNIVSLVGESDLFGDVDVTAVAIGDDDALYVGGVYDSPTLTAGDLVVGHSPDDPTEIGSEEDVFVARFVGTTATWLVGEGGEYDDDLTDLWFDGETLLAAVELRSDVSAVTHSSQAVPDVVGTGWGFAQSFDPDTGVPVALAPFGPFVTYPEELASPVGGEAGFRAIATALAQTWTLADGSDVAVGSDVLAAPFAAAYDQTGTPIDVRVGAESLPAYAGVPYDDTAAYATGGAFGAYGSVVAGSFGGHGISIGVGTDRQVDLVHAGGLVGSDGYAATFTTEGAFRCAWVFRDPNPQNNAFDAVIEDDGSIVASGQYSDDLKVLDGQGNVLDQRPAAYSSSSAVVARFATVAAP